MREFVVRPLESIADVGHGPFEEGGFWTEPVVDRDGGEAVGEQKTRLCGAPVLREKNHVGAAVDYEGFLESANIHMRERRGEEDLPIGIFIEDGMKG
jgi:hypothetical protein